MIPTLDSGTVLDRCLDALAGEREVDEVLVLDAGSTDGSDRRAAAREGVRVLTLPGTGIQARLNRGVEEARNDLVVLLNSDAFVDPGTPRKLAELLEERPGAGASGARLRSEDGSSQKSGDRYKTLLQHTITTLPGSRLITRRPPSPKASGIEPVTWLPLCCAVVRRSACLQIGGWDERFTFYYEDQDLCRRLAEAGWELAIRWDAGAIHIGGGSTSSRDPSRWLVRYHENRVIYLQKWYPRAWRIYSAVWMGRAWLQASLWRARALRLRLRSDHEGASAAREWARAFQRTARP